MIKDKITPLLIIVIPLVTVVGCYLATMSELLALTLPGTFT